MSLESDIEWCRWLFGNLKEQGIWGVPRSGLMFQRQGQRLVLINKMPYMAEMDGKITRDELAEQQDADYFLIKGRFRAAGIVVESAL